jgi:hypothetical protein
VLIGAYLWSRGGESTHLRIEARGQDYSVFVDGRLEAQARLEAPASGGIVLTLDDTYGVPSVPSPRGIDSVRVTDLNTGATLFEDDFSSGPSKRWTTTGNPAPDGGVTGARGPSTLELRDEQWGDIAVDVRYRNIKAASVIVHAPAAGAGGAVAVIRPFWWNRDGNGTLSLGVDGVRKLAAVQQLEVKRGASLSAILAMVLRPYPYIILVLLAALAATAALASVPRTIVDGAASAVRAIPSWLLIGGVVELTFGVLLYLNYSYLSHMPHVPDSVAYVFQAKILASGHFAASPPPAPAFFDLNPFPFVQVFHGDRWAAVYPFGQPLVLALGTLIGAVWLVPPVIGAACVAMIFVLGRELYARRVGVLAMLLLATSPFFLMNASNFMSHSTATFYLLASLLFLAFIDRRPALYGVLAGVFFGLLFNTRPLTALALVPPFAALLLSFVARREHRRTGAIEVAAFVAGGLAMFGAYLLYNHATTGSFSSGYQASGDPAQQVGFGGHHSAAIGIQNEQVQMALLLLVLHGWPAYIGLGFVLLPFILGTRNPWDWFFLACAVFAMAAWALFEDTGVMYGPRYWYESIPFLMLLAARGADRAADLIASAAHYLRARELSGEAPALWASRAVVFALVAALMASSVYGWLLGQRPAWRADFVPEQASALRGFLGMDDRIQRMVEQQRLHNALVLVENCQDFQCYGSVFWRNAPGLDGDIVYAKDIANKRQEIIDAFPGRKVYLARYNTPSLQPYDPSAPTLPRPIPTAATVPTPPP